MTKTQFQKLKSKVKKALYNETMIDEWDMMKEIFEEYYFREGSNFASDKERRDRSFRAVKKLSRMLRNCKVDLAQEVIDSRHRRDENIY